MTWSFPCAGRLLDGAVAGSRRFNAGPQLDSRAAQVTLRCPGLICSRQNNSVANGKGDNSGNSNIKAIVTSMTVVAIRIMTHAGAAHGIMQSPKACLFKSPPRRGALANLAGEARAMPRKAALVSGGQTWLSGI